MDGKHIFVIGLGLIGGSLSLAVKREHPTSVILGFDVNDEQSELAESLNVIDVRVESLEEGVKEAD
ncbi:MAG TPA: prephenate dehydrogenase, partial [Bacillales bacterium]|nr:prephenate dehydrogenase [Bacillales bacterium]